MAFLEIKNVKLSGIAACVPRIVEENNTLGLFKGDEAANFIRSTGIERRRVADKFTTTADLCYHAAEKLIADLNWEKEKIDILVFVTQTPDYILPATSCILQNRLGLNEEVLALDISLGCSGWIYGLQVITSLLSHGQLKKGLLLVGDTTLKPCSPEDKSTWPLFGEAGTATALEHKEGSEGFKYHVATDGSGFETIIIPDGGYRSPVTPASFEIQEIEPGIKRNKLHTVLDGMNVFSFGISKGPETVNKLTNHFDIDIEQVDYVIFHQANLFMNEKIRKKLKLAAEKVPYSLKNFGNTSSATIPLTICSEIGNSISTGNHKIIGCGFGVGLSWGSVYFETNRIVCSDLVEI